MKQMQKLLPVSALASVLSMTLKKLIVDEETRNNIMEVFGVSVSHVHNSPHKIAFLKGKEEDVCVLLKEVVWLEADGSYTKFHCLDGKTQILTANLVSTLRQLMANGWDNFLRIHKSYAVNINYIKSKYGNTLRVGKTELTIGRSYREEFEKHYFTLSKLN